MNNISCKYNFSAHENTTQFARKVQNYGSQEKSPAGNTKHLGWNPVPWYEQKGYNISSMHLAPGMSFYPTKILYADLFQKHK